MNAALRQGGVRGERGSIRACALSAVLVATRALQSVRYRGTGCRFMVLALGHLSILLQLVWTYSRCIYIYEEREWCILSSLVRF